MRQKIRLGESASDEAQVDELDVFKGDVSLCLLLNHRSSVMRVVDFRAGSQARKFDLLLEAATRHGMRRAFTVVEREEASTWTKMGFEKEGSIPGFFKRSDGYILGLELQDFIEKESGTRIRIPGARTADHALAQAGKSYEAAQRLAGAASPCSARVRVVPARLRDIEKAFSLADKSSRRLSRFESFGRGTTGRELLCTARGGYSLLVRVEPQPCFDNAFIDALCAPRGEKEARLIALSLERVCADLRSEDIAAAFSITPVDEIELSAAYLEAGFRRTGRLVDQLRVQGVRKDAFVWSRRLSDSG